MKIKLETLKQGIFVCHILDALSLAEAEQITQGVTKVLSNGKARVLVEFNQASISGEAGPTYFEKALRTQRELAQKMGGDLKYVVPDPAGSKIPGAFYKYEDAISVFLGKSEDLLKDKATLQAEIDQLRRENEVLTIKLEDLSSHFQQPSSNQDLKAALEHYQTLAAELETEKT